MFSKFSIPTLKKIVRLHHVELGIVDYQNGCNVSMVVACLIELILPIQCQWSEAPIIPLRAVLSSRPQKALTQSRKLVYFQTFCRGFPRPKNGRDNVYCQHPTAALRWFRIPPCCKFLQACVFRRSNPFVLLTFAGQHQGESRWLWW